MTADRDAGAGLPAVVRTVAAVRDRLKAWRAEGASVGLVPTMGALHAGHGALMEAARAQCERVVVSVFVNPAQFGPNEDYAAYPRNEAADRAFLEAAGVDLMYAPPVEEVYPQGFATTVSVAGLSEGLCGAHRPGHFDGVATVVAKLLNQVPADAAFFGEKDYQQLQIIKRLARDLDIDVAIRGVATVREADGLAISSRNAYLDPRERDVAPALYAALVEAANAIADGEDAGRACARGARALLDAGFASVDYFECRDADTLAPVTGRPKGPARVLAAARLGPARLIDNVPVG